MSTTDLTHSELAGLIRDYPDTDNNTLAARYNIPVWTVERLAGDNQLRKDPDHVRRRHREARAVSALMNQPAAPSVTLPRRPAADYCPTCGVPEHHWPGCPAIGTDHRPILTRPVT